MKSCTEWTPSQMNKVVLMWVRTQFDPQLSAFIKTWDSKVLKSFLQYRTKKNHSLKRFYPYYPKIQKKIVNKKLLLVAFGRNFYFLTSSALHDIMMWNPNNKIHETMTKGKRDFFFFIYSPCEGCEMRGSIWFGFFKKKKMVFWYPAATSSLQALLSERQSCALSSFFQSSCS